MFRHRVSTEKSTIDRMKIFKMMSSTLGAVEPRLASRLAERIFITPIPTRRPAREAAWAEGAETITLQSGCGPIPVWVWGEGPETVLLVHGWSGRGLQLGALVRPLVERGYRVVAHDGPGHGEARGRTSSMPALAAALGAVARRFGPLEAVIAHSLGCTATVYALAREQLLAARFVMISPASRLHAIRERFGEMTGFPPPVIDRMQKRLEERLGFDWDSAEPLSIAPTLEAPLLVIHDLADRFIPHKEGVDLASAWPRGRLLTTSGLGHHRILRAPEVIESTVAFVSKAANNTAMERKAS